MKRGRYGPPRSKKDARRIAAAILRPSAWIDIGRFAGQRLKCSIQWVKSSTARDQTSGQVHFQSSGFRGNQACIQGIISPGRPGIGQNHSALLILPEQGLHPAAPIHHRRVRIWHCQHHRKPARQGCCRSTFPIFFCVPPGSRICTCGSIRPGNRIIRSSPDKKREPHRLSKIKSENETKTRMPIGLRLLVRI